MAKKRRGIGNRLLHALVWALSVLSGHLYRLLILILRSAGSALLWVGRALWHGVGSLFSRASKISKHQAVQARRPHTGPTDRPLRLEERRSGDLSAFEEWVRFSQSTIGLVVGARGSGKSALGLRLLENAAARPGRQVCAMGFDESTLPAWMAAIRSVEEIPNGAFVLVDEGGISFSSRSSMSSANQLLSALLMVARHKDVSVLFICQNSANLELNAIRQADYLLLRKPSLLQSEFERKKIGQIYADITSGFAARPGEGRRSTYVYSDEFRGFVSNELPSFWSQKVSKPFSGVRLGAPPS